MKKLFFIFSILVLTFIGVNAQMNGGMGNNGNHGGNGGSHGDGMDNTQSVFHYDLNSIITINGKIAEISTISSGQNMNNTLGNHGMLTLKILTEDGILYNVIVAPNWYLENQSIQFHIGDFLNILGSNSSYQQEDSTYYQLVAGKITKDEVVFSLRDDYGRPLWKSTMGAGIHSGNQGYFMDFIYNVNEEVLLSGTVNATIIGGMGGENMNFGYQLSMTLENGNTLNVMLAPYWYLLNQGFSLEEGTIVELTGVYYSFNEENDVFIARMLEFDDTVIILRDEEGQPLWECIRNR